MGSLQLNFIALIVHSNLAFHPHPQTTLCIHCFGQAEEAQEQYQSCVADAGVRKMDLANTKSTILAQIREMVFQCDLTLKAVSCQCTILAVSKQTDEMRQETGLSNNV